ncbi:polysaccharide pyruvyl transferase family protein [Enterococcus faecium]|uniref:polysaccharide pyruvyl transferase family protein n=1 Tax=Enterococcus faecium TaxID=1352 RepID=UPI00295F2EE3|nr:polysaccharide pyruvyl transferase family protein [Enterococcus faecium]WOV56342.1 polysaccharide pyruvyl transferase family protein [Enterococcus faecium]
MNKKSIAIIGGEFNNKGAQAMSFITISRLKKQYPNHKILFVSAIDVLKNNKDDYNFEIIQDPFLKNNFLGENIVRKILKKTYRTNPKDYKQYLDSIEYVFDINGYSLSSQWGNRISKIYADRYILAKKLGKKVAILPQSLGPFDYKKDKSEMSKLISKSLSNLEVVFAREHQGVESLREIGVEENVVYSPDLVLTNKEEIDWSAIYKEPFKPREYSIPSNSVAVIPNMKNFQHGNTAEIMDLLDLSQYLGHDL